MNNYGSEEVQSKKKLNFRIIIFGGRQILHVIYKNLKLITKWLARKSHIETRQEYGKSLS